MDKIEQNKALVERYPFLLPRNVWTDKVPEDYDYSYIRGIHEIPEGWKKLFFQMCEDIRQPLIDANYLDQFRFTQIKEKYNTLRLYHYGAPTEVNEILHRYTIMASYVCTCCGRPADVETNNYVVSYCNDCWNKISEQYCDTIKPIEFVPHYTIIGYEKGEKRTKTVSFKDEWNRYLELIGE